MTKEGLSFPIVEQFYTLQGEGYHTGKAAYFIRIGGCDIGCRWCDSKFSWNSDIHRMITINEILQEVLKTPAKSVVITGGEPTLYNLDAFTHLLKKHNIEIFLETSGAYPLTGRFDWICLSPKQDQPPHPDIFSKANELKVIIYEEKDFLWAEKCAKKVGEKCLLFLQPEWSRYHKNIEKIVNYAKANPKWIISIQTHKFMNIP